MNQKIIWTGLTTGMGLVMAIIHTKLYIHGELVLYEPIKWIAMTEMILFTTITAFAAFQFGKELIKIRKKRK